MPPHLLTSVDEDNESSSLIGPVLSNGDEASVSIAQEFDSRAHRMKRKLISDVSAHAKIAVTLMKMNMTCCASNMHLSQGE